MARIVDAANPFSKTAAGRLTQSGMYMGTIDYMAPEQAEDSHRVDHRADIYSLGCTLFYLLTGQEPFPAATVLKRLLAHMERPAPSLHVARPGVVPAVVEATYQKMMAKRPEDRPQSMAEVLALLETCKAQASLAPTSKSALRVFNEPVRKRAGAAQSDEERPASAQGGPSAGRISEHDLNLEDLVMDVRSGVSTTAVAPLATSGSARARPLSRAATGRPSLIKRPIFVLLALGAVAVLGAALAGFVLLPHSDKSEAHRPTNANANIPAGRDRPAVVLATSSPVGKGDAIVDATAGRARLSTDTKPITPKTTGPTGRGVAAPTVESAKPTVESAKPTVESAKPTVKSAKPSDGSITNSIGMIFKHIRAGSFLMGSPGSAESNQGDHRRQHHVHITRPFYLGESEVTRGQFGRFVSATGYRTDAERDGRGGMGWNERDRTIEGFKPQYSWRNAGFDQNDEHPVVNVSWNDAVAFCGWLSQEEKCFYRLPTEAEWEYSCRAGTTTLYWTGDDERTLAGAANVPDDTLKAAVPGLNGALAVHDGFAFTAPVGRFRPNAFGLHDMHGNVWEWCSDFYQANYLPRSQAKDPTGPRTGDHRVERGGGWQHGDRVGASSDRRDGPRDGRDVQLGFRVVKTIDGKRRDSKLHQPVTSRFGAGNDEGWITSNDDDTPKATKYMRIQSDGSNFWLVAEDLANGKDFGWLAPEKFSGDHADKFGRYLRYRIWTDGNGSGTSDATRYVRLRGGGKVIFIDQATIGKPGTRRWKTYSVRLDSSGGWKLLTPVGQITPASDDDIKDALSDLKDLWLLGEFADGVDHCRLDDVEFGAD